MSSTISISTGCTTTQKQEHSELQAYLYSPSALFLRKDIEVCWENFDPGAEEAVVFKQAVESEYNRRTPLNFFGWQRCSIETKGIRIYVYDPNNLEFPVDGFVLNRGQSRATIGREIDGKYGGMNLNLS
jgi:hypothetical protein